MFRNLSLWRISLVLVLWSCTTGCVGPLAIQQTRLKYNNVVRDTNDEQLLINIVRLRYADSPIFVDLPNITSQFDVSAGGGYAGKYQSGASQFGLGGLSGRDSPTLSYHPREGREIAKSLLVPISTELFSVVNAGADVEQLLWLTVNDLNDVPNATRATYLTPKVADDNTEFRRGIELLASLRARDATELGIETLEEKDDASDPIDKDSVVGRDLINAAKEGFVFRAANFDKVTLFERKKVLVLLIKPEFIHSPEMLEAARIFHLTPGLRRYRIKAELQNDIDEHQMNSETGDTMYLNMRSILQIMTFLSKGVCVPAEHVETGLAPSTPGPDGRPFDWTRVTAGHFFIRSSKQRPARSEVAVKYRGYWFYIAAEDTNSRAVLAFLEILFALQESDDKSTGLQLTLPLGR